MNTVDKLIKLYVANVEGSWDQIVTLISKLNYEELKTLVNGYHEGTCARRCGFCEALHEEFESR